ncbi:ABC transporter ATP-binding protein [Sorangium sp. So ce131]|uniref:ABC transporter ATP-binding protein n=1 Tax=Sorangium sp. So ce131 TaxID=3133282 RepID=UPI003F62FEC5
MDEPVVFRRVSKSFGQARGVEDVSFALRRGAITALLGRNGAGKTTTLRLLTGMFVPDEGEIALFGRRSHGVSARPDIGYLPEERGLYPAMRVLDQLLFFADARGMRRAAAKAAALRWLDRLELMQYAGARLDALSKGNQQKVQLITAVLHDPALVILDEPLSGLDPLGVVLVRDIVRELRAEGRTVVLSTHATAFAEQVADDVVVIDRGRVALAGPLAALQRSGGGSRVSLSFEGDGAALSRLPGVRRREVDGGRAELELEAGADPQAVLAALVRAGVPVSAFAVTRASLESIFIARVGGERRAQRAHAAAEHAS